MKCILSVCLGCLLTGGFFTVPLRAAVFDVKTFGAVGDGKTVDTAAINKAIDAAHGAGGGTVEFSPGTYRSFSIHLQSNITLYLEHGATILAADTPPEGGGDYDPPETNQWDKYEDFGHSHWHNSLIWGENLENISIIGPGLIYGKGLSSGGSARTRAYSASHPCSTAHADGDRNEYPNPRDTLEAGIGNKSIALKNCHNVILRFLSPARRALRHPRHGRR